MSGADSRNFVCTDAPLDGRKEPVIPGFERVDDKWQLRLDYYEMFIQEVTDIDVDNNLSKDEIKTIQNRLEGCFEVYKRENSCICDNFERYEYVDSIETVRRLSRFFRVLVANRVERVQPDQ